MATRKRGITALLAEPTPKTNERRACSDLTNAKIAAKVDGYEYTYGKRGKQKCSKSQTTEHITVHDGDINSLQQMVTHAKDKIVCASEVLENFVQRRIELSIHKALVLIAFANLIKVGKGIIEASDLVALCTGYAKETVRRWAKSFFVDYWVVLSDPVADTDDETLEFVLSSNRGMHAKFPSLILDSEFQLEARKYVRENAWRKGEPNLTAHTFAQWVNETTKAGICDETARLWLQKLGFTQKHHKKGVYFDGHDREDVVAYRSQFVKSMAEIAKNCILPGRDPPQVPRPIIQVAHDESSFHANALQSNFWSDGTVHPLTQKSLGASIMVSDFITEESGFLRDDVSEARVFLETSKEGYWNNELLMVQVQKAVDIFERKYPNAQALFLFDNAPSHLKCSPDALNTSSMNVNPGGKQPVQRSTEWNGEIQHMVLPDGTPKGLRLVLEERGVNTRGMNAERMKDILGSHPDFKKQPCILQEYIEQRGHLCWFYPKFHCELNPIERVWCRAKQYTRQHCNGTIIRLRTAVREGLETATLDLIQKYFKTCRAYEQAYREGHTGYSVEEAVKTYKSHRRVYGNLV